MDKLKKGEYPLNNRDISIIPLPVEVRRDEGYFSFGADIALVTDTGSDELYHLGEYLNERIRFLLGISPELISTDKSSRSKRTIRLKLKADNHHVDGLTYHLSVTENSILVSSSDAHGLFYGIQSLLQLTFPQGKAASEIRVPCAEIRDYPRFRWRGMHLDVSRHFFDKEFIKKYIDLIAMHKMNIFHWHLTDDQGWRIEINRYPRLTEIGAWRKGRDGAMYGGYYTQDDIREIVEYAQERYVTIVPEIEMPGHARAALAAHPEFSCTGGPFDVADQWGVFDDVYCPGREGTFVFLENILDEIINLFPGPYIHIGGDECPKKRWKRHDLCQERIKNEELAGEDKLQSYFIRRIEQYLTSHGKKLVGWDEIMEGGISRDATVMCWRDIDYARKAASSGNDVVMTPMSHCYFDFYQAEEGEPKAIGGFLPLETVYGFEPIPKGLSPEAAMHILGGQGNVWTEYMSRSDHVEYMALPRMCALSEVLWTPRESRQWSDFARRMVEHYRRLDKFEVSYRRSNFT